ncbi:MAG TPA: putative lipid II flippase FtsW [Candidatus Acidoferrales bacterium]|nr:putative lipid II flippase FtsW [Candidatus Acidoferrales bacterium]
MRQGATLDGWIFFAVFTLLGIGVVMVLSTSYLYAEERFLDGFYFFRKQMIAVGLGLTALCVCVVLPLAALRRLNLALLGLALLTLVLVLVPGVGVARGGAQRWLPLAGFSFQPAEFAKLALIVYMADSLARKGTKVETFKFGVLPYLIVGGLFLALIVLEPDLGASFVLGLILFFMLFIAGVRVGHLLCLIAAAMPLLALVILGAPYRVQRLMAFFDPWKEPEKGGFQMIQSFIAFGSGQLWGRGLGESRQKLFYLPEAHTDFIFSVIGEELGLVGALTVLGLFGVIIVRGFRLAAQIEDPFGQYLAFGLTALLGLQASIHMAVVMGLVPTKGLVLPFISYGGSAMVVNLTAAGMLLNLSRRRT